MPSIGENILVWNGDYSWPEQGDEWSQSWGGVSSQWFGTLLPRLRAFVPAGVILEIAPGFGRWTQFLRPLSSRLILVDISAKCIEACKVRFGAYDGIEYHVNDGQSLSMVPDGSVDLVFSFDSLVHVEAEALNGYLAQLAQKLTPDGIAFLHHSNLGEYVDPATGQLPVGIENHHWRALTVSGESVRATCERNGLVCLSQELLVWGVGDVLNDAITVAARRHSTWGGTNVVLRNPGFMAEAERLARLARLYDWAGRTRGVDQPPGGAAL